MTRKTIHGVAVAIGGAGVLLRGRSAAGKSRLAEDLAGEAQRRGWFGRLVADDRVQIVAHGDRLVLSPHAAIAGRVERRGQGVFPVEHEAAVVLRLVVDLVDRDRAADHPARMPAPQDSVVVIEGVMTPRLALAIGEPGAAQAILERIHQIGA
ncbi:MAG TPA: aldolase [Rhodoblastus sp.]|nr:aldolase [Rhodoblastus sp.]